MALSVWGGWAEGLPWGSHRNLVPPCFQDMASDGDAPPAAVAVAGGAHLLGFSDEILLHILSHVPSTDLVLNVRRTCRKLAELCLDKSLTHTVLLQTDYEVRARWGLALVCGGSRRAPRTPGGTEWPRRWAGPRSPARVRLQDALCDRS